MKSLILNPYYLSKVVSKVIIKITLTTLLTQTNNQFKYPSAHTIFNISPFKGTKMNENVALNLFLHKP